MWRIWFFFGILKISFGAPVETSQEDLIPSSELSVLKCLFSSPLTSCDDVKRSAERIPKRIQKLYEKLKRPLLNTTSNEFLDSASLDALPISFLYLIPKVRLTLMTGFTASDIVRKFPFDDALTIKILSLFTDKTNIKNFLNGLADREDEEMIEEEPINGIALISPAVEKEIAFALSKWFPNGSQWEYWLYQASMISGTPVLAHLPNYFLNSLSVETIDKFLFHLRNWRWDHSKLYNSPWSQHSMSVKRIWSNILLNKAEPPSRWTPKILRKFGLFLIGATPDELRQLSTDLRISHDFNILLDLNWDALQARAVFDVGFSGLNELNDNNFNSAKNVITTLLPRQIQQFSYNATDFGYVKLNSGISRPTEKQMLASYLAFLSSRQKTKDITSTLWNNNVVVHAGKFYHLLPPSSLEVSLNESMDLVTLAKTDSPHLSYRQARYLSNLGKPISLLKPETVLKMKGLLKSIPSSKLVELPTNMISHNVKEHLLMFTPGDSLPFLASVLQKIRQDLVESSYLEKMLYNKEFKKYFSLLSARDITYKYRDISSNLFDIVSRNPALERNVRLLPSNMLSALLSLHRQEAIITDCGWTYENLVQSPLKLYISSLTCDDIEMLETSDFMPVIGYYVHQRRAMNEGFPKDMQYCSQTALTKYLKLKTSLRGLSSEPYGLLNLLELHEIRAVGGYILAGLPVELINTLGKKYEIISEIGKLTIPELLTAAPLESIKDLAGIYISYFDELDLKVIYGLGNLVWFLNEDQIHKLNVEDFKLHLHSLEENSIKSLCLNEKERKAWKQLFIRIFGKPDSWSSATLSYLGDLLFVFDGYELERINKTSWTEAADVLTKSTSFYTTLNWPGKSKPIHLYEACIEVLKIPEKISYKESVKQLLRFYLESAQFLLDTVNTVQNILKLNEEPNLVENAQSMGSPIISTSVASHNPLWKDVVVKNDFQEKEETAENYSYDSNEEILSYDEIRSDLLITQKYSEDEGDFSEKTSTIDSFSEKSHAGKHAEETVTQNSEAPVNKLNTSTVIPEDLIRDFVSDSSSKVISKRTHESLPNVPENSQESLEENELNEKQSVKIFRSKSSKSQEEIKEELQRNASRALIIEVPLNRSEFLNFGTATKHVMKISCDAIRMLGKSAGLTLDTQDFENMGDTELEDCSEVLGTMKLDLNAKSFIWNKLKKWKQSGNLMEVGGLVSVIQENEVSNIPLRLTEPWALENLHVLSTHISSPEMMSFITDQFLLQNTDLQALTYESALSLGRLVCTMTLSHQRKYLLSHPKVFTNVAKSLGRNLDCNTLIFKSCIQHLASIATSPEAFGETNKWSANDVSDLGVIVAGLPESELREKDGKGLRAEAFSGITPSAVVCIPPSSFKVLTEKQLSRIPALSAAVISSEQTSYLTPSQYEVIDRVRRQIPPVDLTTAFTSGSSKVQGSLHVSVTLSITFYVTFRMYFYT